MEDKNFLKYVEEECKRQWHDNQEEIYGIWDLQSDDTKAEYYNDMYSNLLNIEFKITLDNQSQ